MARYINADALIDNLNDLTVQVKQSAETWEVDLQVLVRAIQNCETEDVRPNVRGKWEEKDGYDGDVYYDCSACGNSWTTIEGTPWDNGMNFCPNCGADMRKKGEE